MSASVYPTVVPPGPHFRQRRDAQFDGRNHARAQVHAGSLLPLGYLHLDSDPLAVTGTGDAPLAGWKSSGSLEYSHPQALTRRNKANAVVYHSKSDVTQFFSEAHRVDQREVAFEGVH